MIKKIIFILVTTDQSKSFKLASFGNSVYTFYNQSRNNSKANKICNKFGGFLAHVKTDETQTFINQQIDEYRFNKSFKKTDEKLYSGFWIGLHQEDDKNKIWEWSDGEKVSYENWNKRTDLVKKDDESYKGEPNNKDEKCVNIALYNEYFGYWFDNKCTSRNKFICENSKIT